MALNFRGNKNNVCGNVITVDQLSETVGFFTAEGDGRIRRIGFESYKVTPFDKTFFEKLSEIITRQKENNPEKNFKKATLILPDQLFMLDTVTIPVIHSKAMKHSLGVAIEAIYKNASDLKLITYPVLKTKQAVTYGLVGIRKDILGGIRKTFSDNGITLNGITYASNSMVNGAMALDPKLKNDTFMLLDIKENYARFALVVNGYTMGYYDLPFGYNIMQKSRVVSEDALFNHHPAELLVLNAQEGSKARQLNVDGADMEENTEDKDLEKAAAHRNCRSMPEFMQRPTPVTNDEYIYDNFRIFLKWALDILDANNEIVGLGKIDTVYVNMPDEYRFLFDIVNKKQEGSGVCFASLLAEGEDTVISGNLDIFGGYFMNKYNEVNTF